MTIDVTGVEGGGGSASAAGVFEIAGQHLFAGDGNGDGGGSAVPEVKVLEFAVTGREELDPAGIPGAWLLPFLGSPHDEVELLFEADIFVSSVDANVTLELLDTSSVTLRYEYVPEPDAALAAGAALLGIRARSRSR